MPSEIHASRSRCRCEGTRVAAKQLVSGRTQRPEPTTHDKKMKESSMRATLLSHEKPSDPSSVEVHRFRFEIDDDQTGTITESISLRTARVLVEHFADGNAFIRMLKAIVA